MGATSPTTITVIFMCGKLKRTSDHFSRIGNDILFETRQGDYLTFDAYGKTYKETKAWMKKRLENYFNTQCKILKYR